MRDRVLRDVEQIDGPVREFDRVADAKRVSDGLLEPQRVYDEYNARLAVLQRAALGAGGPLVALTPDEIRAEMDVIDQIVMSRRPVS